MKKLPPSFFETDTLTLAKNLLGKYFVRKLNNQTLIGMIVETEAYHETGDESCHAHRGKTPRNSVMFGPPGRLYVYFTYGMHYCMNIAAEAEGIGAAVLIRALEPVEGLDIMRKNRGMLDGEKSLCNGPAKLCQAFAISRAENGHDLQSREIYLTQGISVKSQDIVTATRIGISRAAELPWRFYVRSNLYVSRR